MASTKQRELEQSKQHRKAATRIKILSRESEKWVYSLTTVPVPYSEIPVKAQILAFTARNLPHLNIYPELHKASHSFAEEKSRTTNDKQLFGINGHKCDGFI